MLPTGGSARWASGLTSNDFLKRTSIVHFQPEGLREISGDVIALAQAEGLTAHAESVQTRLDALPVKAPVAAQSNKDQSR